MNYVSTHTYDVQEVRWLLPDPAEQFANPYLAMGNNPVMYTDPNGEFAFLPPLLQAAAIGAGIGAASYTAQAAFTEGGLQQNWNIGGFGKAAAFGAISGAASYGIGQLNIGELNSTFAHGISQGLISEFSGGSFESGFGAATFGSLTSSSLINSGGPFGNSKFGNLSLSGLAGGVGSYASGGNFWTGFGTGVTVAGLNHLMHQDPIKKLLGRTKQQWIESYKSNQNDAWTNQLASQMLFDAYHNSIDLNNLTVADAEHRYGFDGIPINVANALKLAKGLYFYDNPNIQYARRPVYIDHNTPYLVLGATAMKQHWLSEHFYGPILKRIAPIFYGQEFNVDLPPTGIFKGGSRGAAGAGSPW